MRRRSGTKDRYEKQAPRGRKVTVKESNTLLPFLFETLNDQSKSSTKAMLGHGQISVNEKVTTQFDSPLRAGDVVGISYERGKVEFNHSMLKIVWEDDYILVVNKKTGLLSIGDSKTKEKTAFELLSDFMKRNDPRSKLFVLNSLDRETSGLMFYAKNRGVQQALFNNWNEVVTSRCYTAVVEGRLERETGLLTSFASDELNETGSVTVAGNSNETVIRYKVLKSNGRYSMVEFSQETGKKNLIRNQMQAMRHPVAGDKKYGAVSDPTDRVALHANRIYFIHPETRVEMRFEIPVPSIFIQVVK